MTQKSYINKKKDEISAQYCHDVAEVIQWLKNQEEVGEILWTVLMLL